MTENTEESTPPNSESPAPVAESAVGPAETDLDRLARQVSGPEDQLGIAALWRVTMNLDHWWFIAIGAEGEESPAAADVDGEVMLLAFTSGERARDFAVSREMIGAEDDLNAIALPPRDVVDSADSYAAADIDGIIFDAHVAGFSIPPDQLGPVWDAVMSAPTPSGDDSSAADSAAADSDSADSAAADPTAPDEQH